MSMILAFGEVLWDMFDDKKVLGGAPYNFAYRAYSFGIKTIFVSSVGTDGLGNEALEKIEENNMDTLFIQRDDKFPTGTVRVTVDPKKGPDYEIFKDTSYDNILFDEKLIPFMHNLDCIYFGSLIQRSNVSRNTLKKIIDTNKNSLKIFDINLRKNCYSKEIIKDSLEKTDILKLNLQEAFKIKDILNIKMQGPEKIMQKILNDYNIELCLVTLDEKGALAINKNEVIYSPGYKTELKDSVGAGDSFTAGFINMYLQKKPLKECLKFANGVAACVCTTYGGTSYISKEQIKKFMEKSQFNIDEKFNKYKG